MSAGHRRPPAIRLLLDHPGVAPTRRGGDDQADRAGQVADDVGEQAAVVLADLGQVAL